MWTRAELKTNAKAVLNQNYWKSVLTAFILMLLAGVSGNISFSGNRESAKEVMTQISPQLIMALLGFAMIGIIIGIAVNIFLRNPLSIGCYRFFIRCRSGQADIGDITASFQAARKYINVVKIEFLRKLFIGLWSLLLVIPGIVKSYEYAMIPYLLAEYPEMSREDAFAASREMMDGNKWKAFVLDLSFIGWELLGVCTCGILLVFYVEPYRELTLAELYHTLKAEKNIQ